MLTDLDCRNAAPGAAEFKLTDSGRLWLLVKPSGLKVWQWGYYHAGKQKKLTIGRYPQMSLKAARAARDAARLQLGEGRDPSALKRESKRQLAIGQADSFEACARAWHKGKERVLVPRFAKAVLARLEQNAFPTLGGRPIGKITTAEVLDVLRAIERRGALSMAHKVRQHMADVFAWAIAAGMATGNPAAGVSKALLPKVSRHRDAVLTPGKARAVLEVIEKRPGVPAATRLASRLLALTAVRPGVLIAAEASEFTGLDGEEPVWRIPAAKMKLRAADKAKAEFDFVIPLSRQAAETAARAIAVSPSDRWLFPGARDLDKATSESTLSKLYREAGLAGLQHPHGWRTTFSTIMNERAALADRPGDGEVIELMLAHIDGSIRAIYNRALYLPRRRQLAQEWADLLLSTKPDSLIAGTPSR